MQLATLIMASGAFLCSGLQLAWGLYAAGRVKGVAEQFASTMDILTRDSQ